MANTRSVSELRVIRAGLVGYEEAARLQQTIAAERAEGGAPDTLLLLEHPPVYTRGRPHDRRRAADG